MTLTSDRLEQEDPQKSSVLAAVLGPRLGKPRTRTLLLSVPQSEDVLSTVLSITPRSDAVLHICLSAENAGKHFAAIGALLRRAAHPASSRSKDEDATTAAEFTALAADAVHNALQPSTDHGLIVVVERWQWIDRASRHLLEELLATPRLRQRVTLVATWTTAAAPAPELAGDLFHPGDVVGLHPTSESKRPTGSASSRSDRESAVAGPIVLRQLPSASDAARSPADVAGRDVHLHETVPAIVATRMRDWLRGLQPDVRSLIASLLAEEEATARSPDDGAEAPAFTAPLEESIEAQLLDRMSDGGERASSDFTLPVHDEEGARALLHEAAQVRLREGRGAALQVMLRCLAGTARSSAEYAERAVVTGEDAAASGDWPLALRTLRGLDLASLEPSLLDRAVPLLARALNGQGGAPAVRQHLAPLTPIVHGSPVSAVVALPLATLGWEGDISRRREKVARIARELAPSLAPRSWTAAQQWLSMETLDQGMGVADERLSAMQPYEQAQARLQDTADALAACWAYQCDDLNRSRFGLARLVRHARATGELPALTEAHAHAATVELLAGRSARATAHLQEANEDRRPVAQLPVAVHLANGLMAIRRNDSAALQALLDKAFGLATPHFGGVVRLGMSGLHAAYSADWERAFLELTEARELAEKLGISEPGRRFWIDIELARAAIHRGEHDVAEAIAARLESIAAGARRPHAAGQALRIRGLLRLAHQDNESGTALLRAAVRELERSGFHAELARTRLELAETLNAAGSDDECSLHLGLLRAEIERIADPRLHAAVEALQRARDQNAPRRLLTEAESRVAALAATGRTNRQIASELFLSVRTVETHLANSYRKLGIRTRTQLALQLNER